MRMKQYAKMAVQNVFLPAVYRLHARTKITPGLIVFADAHHQSRPESMKLLAEKFLKDPSCQVEEMYLDYQRASFSGVLMHMCRFMRLYARAQCVIICDNFLPAASCRKRKETLVVQLWHACGSLKKFGYDTTEDIPANYRGNVFRNTDLVTVSAPFCERPFASAMRLPRRNVQALGVSRTDMFFDQDWRRDVRKRFFAAFPGAEEKKIVLWAPTFRGSPGSPDCIELDLNALQNELGDDCLVLAKLHPHMQAEKEPRGKNGNISAISAFSTSELFAVTDILIADYSSLIFEYMLFRRPIVLYVPDYETYTGKRGFYMDFADIPGERIFNADNLPAAVKRAAGFSSEGNNSSLTVEETRYDQFLTRYMSACDGQATERIYQWIKERIFRGDR